MVIWVPSKVCHTRNILTSWVRFSGLLFTFSFHDIRYSKNVPWSQSNLWSPLELYTFKNNFNFFLDSLTLCTSKKSKKSQTFNKLYLFPGNSEFGTALQKKHVILFFQLKLLRKKLNLKEKRKSKLRLDQNLCQFLFFSVTLSLTNYQNWGKFLV